MGNRRATPGRRHPMARATGWARAIARHRFGGIRFGRWRDPSTGADHPARRGPVPARISLRPRGGVHDRWDRSVPSVGSPPGRSLAAGRTDAGGRPTAPLRRPQCPYRPRHDPPPHRPRPPPLHPPSLRRPPRPRRPPPLHPRRAPEPPHPRPARLSPHPGGHARPPTGPVAAAAPPAAAARRGIVADRDANQVSIPVRARRHRLRHPRRRPPDHAAVPVPRTIRLLPCSAPSPPDRCGLLRPFRLQRS